MSDSARLEAGLLVLFLLHTEVLVLVVLSGDLLNRDAQALGEVLNIFCVRLEIFLLTVKSCFEAFLILQIDSFNTAGYDVTLFNDIIQFFVLTFADGVLRDNRIEAVF